MIHHTQRLMLSLSVKLFCMCAGTTERYDDDNNNNNNNNNNNIVGYNVDDKILNQWLLTYKFLCSVTLPKLTNNNVEASCTKFWICSTCSTGGVHGDGGGTIVYLIIYLVKQCELAQRLLRWVGFNYSDINDVRTFYKWLEFQVFLDNDDRNILSYILICQLMWHK